MTEPLFLGSFTNPRIGEEVFLDGDEGHHAVNVRRCRLGEVVLVADGQGNAVRGSVKSIQKGALSLEVTQILSAEPKPLRYVAAQALPKGDRAQLAVEVMTEVGIDEIIPWQAARSIVKWTSDRAERGLGRWQAAAREATKQSRRFRIPQISPLASHTELLQRVAKADLAIVLHESASVPLASLKLPVAGEVLFIVGPEGGLTDAEVASFAQAGAHVVIINDAVLRTSSAGVVALAQLQALAAV